MQEETKKYEGVEEEIEVHSLRLKELAKEGSKLDKEIRAEEKLLVRDERICKAYKEEISDLRGDIRILAKTQ